MLTDAQRAIRTRGIGASEVAAVLGLDQYRTPFDVWADKTGRGPVDDENEAMWWGSRFEPVILDRAERDLGTIARPDANADPESAEAGHFAHPIAPMFAHVDGMLGTMEAGAAVVEAKATSLSDGWGEPGTDEVPDRVLLQVTAQMICSGSEEAYVARLMLDKWGDRFSIFRVGLNGDLAHHVVGQISDWWERHIVGDTPPEITDRAPDMRVFDLIEREAGKVAQIPPEIAERFLRARAAEKAAKAELEVAKAALVSSMGDAEQADAGDFGKFSYKHVNTSRFDQKAFKEAHPDLHKQFVVASGYHRLNAPREKKS
ncbi:MAG: YqaJ viral recombinase family protein [Phycisphaerales bacterium]